MLEIKTQTIRTGSGVHRSNKFSEQEMEIDIDFVNLEDLPSSFLVMTHILLTRMTMYYQCRNCIQASGEVLLTVEDPVTRPPSATLLKDDSA